MYATEKQMTAMLHHFTTQVEQCVWPNTHYKRHFCITSIVRQLREGGELVQSNMPKQPSSD